jgi:DNA-binding beta-propeller fold protein YncE
MKKTSEALKLVYGIDPEAIFISETPTDPETNEFSFNIANPEQAPKVQFINTDSLTPNDDLPSYGKPDQKYNLSWFYIWFPWGTEEGDFATSDASLNITVSPADNNDKWYCVKKHSNEVGIYWTLFPKKDTVLDPQESVAFIIDQIISSTAQGMSYMYIENHNIPGFDDNKVTNKIWKYKRVKVDSLEAAPNPSALVDGKAEVEITWKAENYESLLLMPFFKDVTKLSSYKAVLTKSTDITLVATGKGVSNTQYSTVSAEVLQGINSFEVYPTSIYYTDFPHSANMFWDVETNDEVYIINENDQSKGIFPANGQVVQTITEPGMWSVTPKDDATLKRSALIQAFKINSNKLNVNCNANRIAASSIAEFVAVVGDGSNTVSIVNSLTGDLYCAPIQVGEGPVDVLFTQAGDFLITANQKGESLSIIPITYNNQTSAFDFGVPKTVALSDSPQRIAISPDDKNIFVSICKSDTYEGNLVVVSNGGNGNFTVSQTVKLGKKPAGIAVFSSGMQVFVANSGDNTISVVGYNNLTQKYEFVRNAQVSFSGPSDLALAGKDKMTLLVIAQNSNKMYAFDAHDIGSSQQINIGTSPADIMVCNNRAYAYITCSGSNTLTLVDCYLGFGKCKVLESIAVGSKPQGLAVSNDGYVVFAANSGDKSFSSLNLENYKMNSFTPAIGKGHNSIAASADGSTVVTWFNPYYIHLKQVESSKGIFIYNTETQTGSNGLNDEDVAGVVFHPDVSKHKAFAITFSENQVSVINTQNFYTQLNFPIPNSLAGAKQYPRALSLSQDGKTMFVAVTDATHSYSVIVFDVDADKGNYMPKANIPLATINGAILFDIAPDASNAFLVDINSAKVYTIVFDTQYKLDPNVLTFKSIPLSMKVSPNNDFVYILTKSGMNTGFGVIDIKAKLINNYSLPASYNTKVSLQQLCISPDGKRLFITDTDVVGVRVVSTKDLRIVQTLSYENNITFPYGITILPDASHIFLAGYISNNLGQISQIGAVSNNTNQLSNNNMKSMLMDKGGNEKYSGFFVRDFIGEKPSGSTSGKSWTDSPDIITNGANLLPDPTVLTDKSNYDQGLPAVQNQTPLQNNYVYMRAINTTDGPQDSTIYMYYVDTTIVLWPQNWQKLGIQRLNKMDNSAKLSAIAKDQIVAVNPPFQWIPPREHVHYCLTCWIQNGADQTEPDLYSIGSVSDMAKFIFEHNNVAWRNTIEVDAVQPTIQNSTQIIGPEEGGPVCFGVRCDVPAGGYIQFNVPGPTPDSNIIYPKTQIPMKGFTPMVTVNYPPQKGGYETTIEFTYYKGDGDLPDGSIITPLVGTDDNPVGYKNFISKVHKEAPHNLLDVHLYKSQNEVFTRELMGVPIKKIFLVGSVRYKLLKK